MGVFIKCDVGFHKKGSLITAYAYTVQPCSDTVLFVMETKAVL